MSAHRKQAWLFGPATDLSVFAGSTLGAVLLVLVARAFGVEGETPLWAWVLLVLGIDVSHVWATLYRVYLDGAEVQRRPLLYLAIPIAVYAAGFAAYQQSPLTFWRLFAYVALFHFIRQQYGWVALYNRKRGSPSWERWLDTAAIYACTVGPALWWHASLPRPFSWFVANDFVSLPSFFAPVSLALMWLVLAAWSVGQLVRLMHGEGIFVGRVVLVLATFVSWYGGIVLAPDDLSFTAMNVALHGVPYFALLYRYAKNRNEEPAPYAARLPLKLGVAGFLVLLFALAYLEELGWDRFVWHEHATLFGSLSADEWQWLLPFLVPLLALPQATHYVLDAFIWRPRQDPQLLSRLGWTPRPSVSAPRSAETAPAPSASG